MNTEHDGEHCRDCGGTYDGTLWWAPDELWQRLTGWGEAGLLCPPCFSRRAHQAGLLLCWRPEILI